MMAQSPTDLSVAGSADVVICAPGKLQGHRTSPTTATLTWDEPYATCPLCPNAAGYEVSCIYFPTMHVARPPCDLVLGNTFGETRVYVRAKGTNGSLSRPSAFLLLRSPDGPAFLRASDFTENSFRMSWQVPEEGFSPAFDYLVYHNGEVVDSVSGLTYLMPSAAKVTDVYEVRARSNAGNLSEPAVLDITSPDKPTGLFALKVSGKTIVLIWSITPDNVKVVSYDIVRNGVVIGTTLWDAPAFEYTQMVPEVPCTFAVKAVDASGNRSEASDAITVETAWLGPPRNLRTLDVTPYMMTVAWDRPQDAVGLINYTCEADNQRGSYRILQSMVQGATFRWLVSRSTYTVTVFAEDAAVHRSEVARFKVKTLG